MLALACVALLAAAGPWSLADAAAGREEAFIGYSERAAECKDRLEDCHGKAKRNGCIRDPYNMRTFCPISCGVSKCMSTGTLKVGPCLASAHKLFLTSVAGNGLGLVLIGKQTRPVFILFCTRRSREPGAGLC